MRNLTEENLTDAVIGKLQGCADPRLREIMTGLVKHLHAFIRDVEPTEEEWFKGIKFLTDTGHTCDGVRQEFILLSDTLGVSMLVDAINNRKPSGATESSVLGPFYAAGAPDRAIGADITGNGEGEKVHVSGEVTDLNGNPIQGACLDVWQTATNGLYHIQDSNQRAFNLCGKFYTDDKGHYAFTTLKPVSYSIPTDGPVSAMLEALGRHTFRPAHIHFIVSAKDFEPVITQVFTEGDEYIESDAVFGVKNSLVKNYLVHESKEDAKRYGMEAPFYTLEYNFTLQSAAIVGQSLKKDNHLQTQFVGMSRELLPRWEVLHPR